MPGFFSDDERASWARAESFIDRARTMMGNAESALDRFKRGKELNRQRCALKGISTTDAAIRWAESARAKTALSDNSFHVALATMYYGAAAANYTRAIYLRQGPETERRPETGSRPEN